MSNSLLQRVRRTLCASVLMITYIIPTSAQHPIEQDFATLPPDRWPGRLIVGGKTLDDFVAISAEPHTDAGWTRRVFQSVSLPELQIRAQWRTIGAATEWIPTLVNNAPKISGRVTEVRSLAASWQTRGPVDFHGNKGSFHRSDDFLDLIERDIDLVDLNPFGGRSSDQTLPFFAVTDGHDSLAIGIGWSGQWSATVRHSAGILQVEVGLEKVGFVLRPWESVRLPSVLLAKAPQATADQARRIVRSHLINHVVPKTADGKSPNYTSYSTMYNYFHVAPDVNEEAELAAVEHAAKMGIETYWIDAVWYGNKPDWSGEVGNWHVRKSDFPRGLRPISDRAHALGMKFVFWMEPERAQPDSDWARAHPDLFLSYPDDGNTDPWRSGVLLNLGDPRAVDLAFERISSLITEFNSDIYRQDINTRPLDAWRAADAPDRVGITEIRNVEGLYALWDRILAAHPGIIIDNCASGGRRTDLETLRRSVPIWRSDYVMDKPALEVNLCNQFQSWGLGHWIADHLGAVKTFDAYAARSGLSTGLIVYRDLPKDKDDPEYADFAAMIAENKRLRPFIYEERIGLIAPSLDETWMAFQHHRHSDASGIIVALRGPGAADQDTVTLKPEHIDPKRSYRVTRWDDYRASPPERMTGAALQKLLVTIPQTSSSVLVEYVRSGR